MSYMNLTIVGNLGGDTTMRYTPDGTAVANFSMAVNRKWTGADGDAREKVTWFRVTVWRKLAEALTPYLVKGKQVMVVGELNADENGNPRIWTGQDGSRRASFEVTANVIRLLGSGNGKAAPAEESEDTGDIPF